MLLSGIERTFLYKSLKEQTIFNAPHPVSRILALQPKQQQPEFLPLAIIWSLLQQFFSLSQKIFHSSFLLIHLLHSNQQVLLTYSICLTIK